MCVKRRKSAFLSIDDTPYEEQLKFAKELGAENFGTAPAGRPYQLVNSFVSKNIDTSRWGDCMRYL